MGLRLTGDVGSSLFEAIESHGELGGEGMLEEGKICTAGEEKASRSHKYMARWAITLPLRSPDATGP
jgi:hypothetical protein